MDCVHWLDDEQLAGITVPDRFTWPFNYVPCELSKLAVRCVDSYVDGDAALSAAVSAGKMLGVLVVNDESGRIGFTAAFSGLLCGTNRLPWFVPPVYDLLQPDGEFKVGEHELDLLNAQVARLENDERLARLRREYAVINKRHDELIASAKTTMDEHRKRRHAMRTLPDITAKQLQDLERESQHEKAELRRLKADCRRQTTEIDNEIAAIEREIDDLKRERHQRSIALQRRLSELYVVHNANGECRNLATVFAPAIAPSGSGECCAPKLLEHAYRHRLHPIAIAEWWRGASPTGEVRHDGHFYPACRSKCLPILTFMLQGLDVDDDPSAVPCNSGALSELYDDRWLTVVVKPAGMLSVPGKILQDSALTRYIDAHPEAGGPIVVHRLDQETSGILVFAKDKATHKALQEQFEQRLVEKVYIAVVEGNVEGEQGVVDLPLRADVNDRPRQCVADNGRAAVTQWQVLERGDRCTRLLLHPLTGRTHQLRVHCSHPAGLGHPIVGDKLYGKAAERLMLHASRLTFIHPSTGERLTFESEPPF